MQLIPNSFQRTKLRQPTAGRDSCLKINEYYVIFEISYFEIQDFAKSATANWGMRNQGH